MKNYQSIALTFVCVSSVGCVSNDIEESYQSVAKSWNQMVRASQVIPVYPLREDIRPGDMFITPFTTRTEIESWKEGGYLRLDNVYARLNVDVDSEQSQPRAAFPTYSFSVDSRTGGGLALPVSSVPVALAVSGAKSATGTISFKDAYSNGKSDSEINKLVQAWVDNKNIQAELKEYTQNENHKFYVLRVITRTFSVKSVDVSLSFAESAGFKGQVGAPPSTPELWGTSKAEYQQMITYLEGEIAQETSVDADASEDVQAQAEQEAQAAQNGGSQTALTELQQELETVQKLKNKSLIEDMKRKIEQRDQLEKYKGFFLPGASYKFSSFSEYGAGMQESFEVPLVFGYWATEYIINTDGSLIPIRRSRSMVENPKLVEKLVEKIERERRKNPVNNPDPKPDLTNINSTSTGG